MRSTYAIPGAAGVLLAASAASMSLAMADSPYTLSANIGAVSNYLWRGVTQTDDGPAIQGGVDFAHESGFSAGAWASNVDFATGANYELDLYMGYDFNLGIEDASLGLSTIYYAYPDDDFDIDFWEVGIAGGYKWISAGINYTVWGGSDNEDALFDQGDWYFSLALEFPLQYDFSIKLFGGYYDFKNGKVDVFNDDGEVIGSDDFDYAHWGVAISKAAGDFGTFSLSYEQNDNSLWDDDPKVWVGWNKEF